MYSITRVLPKSSKAGQKAFESWSKMRWWRQCFTSQCTECAVIIWCSRVLLTTDYLTRWSADVVHLDHLAFGEGRRRLIYFLTSPLG